MFKRNETGNALIYQTALNSLLTYKSSQSLVFSDLSVRVMEEYQEYLVDKGCKVNTISNYLRTIRAIFNKAIKARVVDRNLYPFTEVSIKSEKTSKRAYNKEVIKAFENIELPENSAVSKARDFYMFSFYLIGINFTDIAYLKRDNIVDDRIEYTRRKTGKEYSIKILPKAVQLINRYSDEGRKYLFPILYDNIVENGLPAKKLIHQWIKTTNKYLKSISTKLELSKQCTTYTVRHSWGTIAKRLGYSKEMISEAMGHQQGNQVTEIYLDSFDKEVIDEMHLRVVDL